MADQTPNDTAVDTSPAVSTDVGEGVSTSVAEASPRAEATFDRSALEAKTAARLAALGSDASEAGESEEGLARDRDTEDVSPAGEIDKETSAPAKQPPAPAAGPTLPDAIRRSLHAYEWSDEDIDDGFKANPAGFLTFAQKMHNSRTNELKQWANIGRQAAQRAQAGPVESPSATVPMAPANSGFQPIDIDGLVKEFGNEELVRQIASPVNTVIEQINSIFPDLQKGVEEIRAARLQTVSTQIESFFTGEPLKAFADFYGVRATATEDQMGNRAQVLQTADALRTGAAYQGRDLSVEESLALAHDLVSAEFHKQVVRKEVRAQVQRRSNGLSVKPQGSAPAKTGPAASRNQLEQNVKDRLNKVFQS